MSVMHCFVGRLVIYIGHSSLLFNQRSSSSYKSTATFNTPAHLLLDEIHRQLQPADILPHNTFLANMSARNSNVLPQYEQEKLDNAEFENISLEPPAYSTRLPHRPTQPPLWRRLLRRKWIRILLITLCLLLSIGGAIGAGLFLATVVHKFEFLKAGPYVVIPSAVPPVVSKSTTTIVVTETNVATLNTTVLLSSLQSTATVIATVTPGATVPVETPHLAAAAPSLLPRNRRPKPLTARHTHDELEYYHPVVEARKHPKKSTSTPTSSSTPTSKPADSTALLEFDYPRPIWGGRPGKR
jgi:hypothetical protein